MLATQSWTEACGFLLKANQPSGNPVRPLIQDLGLSAGFFFAVQAGFRFKSSQPPGSKALGFGAKLGSVRFKFALSARASQCAPHEASFFGRCRSKAFDLFLGCDVSCVFRHGGTVCR